MYIYKHHRKLRKAPVTGGGKSLTWNRCCRHLGHVSLQNVRNFKGSTDY